MELCEIFGKLLGKAGPYHENQTALARDIGVDQSLVSKLARRALPMWEEHFDMFLRLLPVCERHGIDPSERSNRVDETTREGLRYVDEEIDKEINRSKSKSEKRGKKKLTGGISTRGNDGSDQR